MTIRRARSTGVLCTVAAFSAATMLAFVTGADAADASTSHPAAGASHPTHPVSASHPTHPVHARPTTAPHPPLLTLDLTGVTKLVTGTTRALLGPHGLLGGSGLLGTTPTSPPRPVQHTRPPAAPSPPSPVAPAPAARHASAPAGTGVVAARAHTIVTILTQGPFTEAPRAAGTAPRRTASPAAHAARHAFNGPSAWVPLGMGWLPAHASLVLVILLVVFSGLVALVVRAGSHRGGRRRR